MIGFLKKRLAERSTWAALSAACTAGLGATASMTGAIAPWVINGLACGVAICGFVVALLPSPNGVGE
ncbi:hypothetical protein [Rhizorhabdus histidinilytica]|uniref:hypothetical protein n=1 Tax=Rhizorhabdus histidinilytica TaxID=439228 RepID=UPI003220981D